MSRQPLRPVSARSGRKEFIKTKSGEWFFQGDAGLPAGRKWENPREDFG